jgi:hypothetical protein
VSKITQSHQPIRRKRPGFLALLSAIIWSAIFNPPVFLSLRGVPIYRGDAAIYQYQVVEIASLRSQ